MKKIELDTQENWVEIQMSSNSKFYHFSDISLLVDECYQDFPYSDGENDLDTLHFLTGIDWIKNEDKYYPVMFNGELNFPLKIRGVILKSKPPIRFESFEIYPKDADFESDTLKFYIYEKPGIPYYKPKNLTDSEFRWIMLECRRGNYKVKLI